VRSGQALRSAIHTYDTAATVLHLLGVPPPAGVAGRPVEAALVGRPPARTASAARR
jgi:arylsulfatase A-like enzyme